MRLRKNANVAAFDVYILSNRTNHYNEHGHRIGYSWTTLLGYTNHHRHKVGHSREGLFGTVHYNESGHKIGRSHEGIRGYKAHYENHGHKVGYTRNMLMGKTTQKNKLQQLYRSQRAGYNLPVDVFIWA